MCVLVFSSPVGPGLYRGWSGCTELFHFVLRSAGGTLDREQHTETPEEDCREREKNPLHTNSIESFRYVVVEEVFRSVWLKGKNTSERFRLTVRG